MASQPLVLTDPNMLAEFVRQSELKTFWEKRYAAPADLGAVLFRDGQVVDGFKGTQFSIGGVWENLKGVLGGSHHYEILLADLKPFSVVFPVRGMSRDAVEVVGEAIVEMQLNPDKPTNILGLMRAVSRNETDGNEGKDASRVSQGRKALTIPDVMARLEPHFRDRIFEHVLGRHDADDIRGNRELQDQIQGDMMKEAERILGDLGVMVRDASMSWAMNDAERQKFEQARIERAEKMKDYSLDLLKRQVQREGDATAFQIETKVDQETLKRAGEDQLRDMVLESEVAFVDAREAHVRRQEFEALHHEASILLDENKAKTEIALGEIEDQTAKTRATHNLRKVEFDLKSFENDFNRQQLQQQNEFRRDEALLDAEGSSDVTEAGVRGRDADFGQNFKEAKAWQEQAIDKLAALNDIELAKESGLADVEIRKKQVDTQGEVDRMLAAGSLTPEQLSEVMPGLSTHAAQVAIERAKADGQNAREMLEMAQRQNTESREHEHRMFDTGMKGGANIAAGAGGKGGSGSGSASETVECPKCGKVQASKARHCGGCGHQLRT